MSPTVPRNTAFAATVITSRAPRPSPIRMTGLRNNSFKAAPTPSPGDARITSFTSKMIFTAVPTIIPSNKSEVHNVTTTLTKAINICSLPTEKIRLKTLFEHSFHPTHMSNPARADFGI